MHVTRTVLIDDFAGEPDFIYTDSTRSVILDDSRTVLKIRVILEATKPWLQKPRPTHSRCSAEL
jgi:hypothetical protein